MPRKLSWLPSLLSESIDELIVEFDVVLEKGKTDNKQGRQIQLKPSIYWNSLYYFGVTSPHVMWHHDSHWSQLNARWFQATVLRQTAQFSGPGFTLISPLTIRRIRWKLQSDFSSSWLLKQNILCHQERIQGGGHAYKGMHTTFVVEFHLWRRQNLTGNGKDHSVDFPMYFHSHRIK